MAGDKSVRFRLFGEDVTASQALDKLGKKAENTQGKLAGMGKGAAKLGLLTAALASTTTTALSASAALATASGSALLLPAAGAAGAAAFGALKIGAMGLADAFEAGLDPEKPEEFAAALKKLAPAARETVKAALSLKPAFDGMRMDVQERLFAGLGSTVAKLGRTYLPIARDGLGEVASAFNAAAQITSRELLSGKTTADVKTIFSASAQSARNFAGVGASVVSIIRDLAAEGSKFLPMLTSGFAKGAADTAKWVSALRASGGIERTISAGLEAVRKLMTVVGALGSIVMSVFKASSASGADFLSTVTRITTGVSALLASGKGQTALKAMFDGVRAGLDSVMAGMAGAGPLFAQLGPLVGELARQFGAVLGAQLQIVLPILTALAPVIASVLGTVGPFLSQNAGLVSAFAIGLAAFAVGIKAVTLATTLWSAATKVAAIVSGLWTAAQWLLNVALSANPIGLVIIAIAALVAGIVIAYQRSATFRAIVQAAMKGAQTAFGWVLTKVTQLVNWIRSNWPRLKGLLTAPISLAVKFITDKWNGVLNAFKSAPGKISGYARSMWTGLVSSFRSAINQIIGWWNRLSFDMPSVGPIPGFSAGTPDIPYLAKGGLVRRPTLAMVGEAGPEAVVPLSRAGLGLGGITVNVVAGAVGNKEELARAIVDALKTAQSRGLKLGAV